MYKYRYYNNTYQKHNDTCREPLGELCLSQPPALRTEIKPQLNQLHTLLHIRPIYGHQTQQLSPGVGTSLVNCLTLSGWTITADMLSKNC